MGVRSLAVFAITAVVAQGGISPTPPISTSAVSPIVRSATDARTGLEIRMSQTGRQEFVVDVGDDQVQIHKQIHPSETVTTLTAGTDVLRITTSAHGVVIAGTGGSVTTNGVDQRLDQAGAMLKRSPAAQAALRLLSSLDLTPLSSARHILLVTRALLEVPQGLTTAVETFTAWARQAANRTRVTLAGFGSKGPGECWDEYEKWVMKILDSYAECWLSCRWYIPFCREACGFEWMLKAQLAFDWLLACSGGLPVK